MTRTIASDSNNDLYLADDGNLAIVTGLDAVLQAAQQAAQTIKGEMVFDVEEGLPNFDTVWSGRPSLPVWEAHLRRAILAVDGVQSITELILSVSDNVLSYSATISTIYGAGAING